jgi:hypothetical protein
MAHILSVRLLRLYENAYLLPSNSIVNLLVTHMPDRLPLSTIVCRHHRFGNGLQ